MEVYRASMPFMVTNLTGMLTYGGFIWISSFFLRVNDVAKIAVLPTFVLMNLYQLYDVLLTARLKWSNLTGHETLCKMRVCENTIMNSNSKLLRRY